jgi:hypothetical protein
MASAGQCRSNRFRRAGTGREFNLTSFCDFKDESIELSGALGDALAALGGDYDEDADDSDDNDQGR